MVSRAGRGGEPGWSGVGVAWPDDQRRAARPEADLLPSDQAGDRHFLLEPLMTAIPVGDLQPIDNRPGMQSRDLIGSEHGVSSFYVAELTMEQGAFIPLHSHPVEEAFMIAEGQLTLQMGDQTIVAEAESVVNIPAGVPHAVRNEAPQTARALAGAAYDRAKWFKEATTYLDGGLPRLD
jgi:quercetin dioxygenase-like cupin family protein